MVSSAVCKELSIRRNDAQFDEQRVTHFPFHIRRQISHKAKLRLWHSTRLDIENPFQWIIGHVVALRVFSFLLTLRTTSVAGLGEPAQRPARVKQPRIYHGV